MPQTTNEPWTLKITPKIEHTYKESGWSRCPSCDSKNLEGGITQHEGDFNLQRIDCLDCGAVWEDVYTINNMMECSL